MYMCVQPQIPLRVFTSCWPHTMEGVHVHVIVSAVMLSTLYTKSNESTEPQTPPYLYMVELLIPQ